MIHLKKYNESVDNKFFEIDSRNYYDLLGSDSGIINYNHIVKLNSLDIELINDINYDITLSKLPKSIHRHYVISGEIFDVTNMNKYQNRYSICKVDDEWFLIHKWRLYIEEGLYNDPHYYKCDRLEGLKEFLKNENLI